MLDQVASAEKLYDEYCDLATTSEPHFETASQEVIKAYRNRDPTSVLSPDFLFEIEAIAFMMAATPVFMRL